MNLFESMLKENRKLSKEENKKRKVKESSFISDEELSTYYHKGSPDYEENELYELDPVDSDFERLNDTPIEIEYVEDEHNPERDFRASFWWDGQRQYLDDIVRVHNNPWFNQYDNYPTYIHGISDDYMHPFFVEIVDGGDAVNIYREKYRRTESKKRVKEDRSTYPFMNSSKTWEDWVTDTIYVIYREYDIQGLKEQQEVLKSRCLKEIKDYPNIKYEITRDSQMRYFIMQLALESVKDVSGELGERTVTESRKIIKEDPDWVTDSGRKDIYESTIHRVLDSLKLDNLNWDVKGTKFTLRLDEKTVIVTPIGDKFTVKVTNANTQNSNTVRLVGNYIVDVPAVEAMILAI